MRYQVWIFLRLVWGEWASRVTGSLSAVLLLLGLGISVASAFGVAIPAQSILQIATWLLVAICGGQAAYAVWARERAARDQAEAELTLLRNSALPGGGHSTATPPRGPARLAFDAYRESQSRQMFGVDIRTDALRISRDSTPEFEIIEALNGRVRRTLCVCIENIDRAKFISNCKVHADFGKTTNALLIDSFTLNAGEKRFAPIVFHMEDKADDYIHVIAPMAGGFFAEAYAYLYLPITETVMTIKASCAECRPAQLVCRVYVDETGKTRMEKV
jgi:hypothetical protein